MIVLDHEQRSPEWFEARCGVPSASYFDKIVKMDGSPSKQRKKYMYKLAGEFVSGVAEESYQNAAMMRGTELEPEARGLYEAITGKQVQEVGFCIEDHRRYGCSPDGLVGEDGAIEIKCPNIATHVGYLIDNKLPSDYFQQVQGVLLVTGLAWCDFVSYYPGLNPLIIRVKPNKGFLKKARKELDIFCGELAEVIEKIK